MKITRLKRDRTAHRIDRLVFNLRWLLLAIAALQVYPPDEAHTFNWLAMAVMIMGLVYNFILTFAEFMDTWPTFLPWLILAADSAFGLALFVTTGGGTSPLIWIGMLPGLTAALRHGWPTALVIIVAFSLAQAGVTYGFNPQDISPLGPVSIAAAILWPLIVGSAVGGARLRAYIERTIRKGQRAEERRAQALREHARAIYEMSSRVSATLGYEEVLEAALTIGTVGAEGGQRTNSMLTAVLLFENDQLHVASAQRFPPADERVICPARQGVLEQVVRLSEPAIIADSAHDPELQQFIGLRKCRSIIILPLRAGFETYGVVLYGHPQPDFFDEDQRAFLVAVVNQAVIALQNAQLYRNLREEKARLVEVQEEAQKKLARDLHDGPTQAVASLAMRANFVRRLVERDPKAAGEELFKMEDLARRTTKEIRHMLFTLRPLVLESQGLTAALNQLAEKMRDTYNQNVIIEAEPKLDDKLELNQQGVLFYIIEEAVGNARKHAEAAHIWVRLKTQRDVLVVEIQDDGVGFNVGTVDSSYDKRGSLGMVNMRERTEMLNGAIKIDSAEGKGTRITVLVPLNEAAATRLHG